MKQTRNGSSQVKKLTKKQFSL